MRIARINGNSLHSIAVGSVAARVSALEPDARGRAGHGGSSAGEPAAPLAGARSQSQPQRRPEPPSPEARPEPAPEADKAAMRAPTRAAFVAARVSIRPSMSLHLRERGRTICDRILADSPCRYRWDSDTMRIVGELEAVCAVIRRCERAMHHGSLYGFEFNHLSQAETDDHGRHVSEPVQAAAGTNREARRACPELPPENPGQRRRTEPFAGSDDSAASG